MDGLSKNCYLWAHLQNESLFTAKIRVDYEYHDAYDEPTKLTAQSTLSHSKYRHRNRAGAIAGGCRCG